MIVFSALTSLCYAEVFYYEDFEDGAKNWEILGNVEISDKISVSGSKSVLIAEGTGLADSANLLIQIPDREVLYDIIWIYLESAEPGAGYMYLPTWTLTPGAEDWVGPHVCLRYGDGSGGVISWHSNGWFDQAETFEVGVWYKVKTIMNINDNTFEIYYQKESEDEETLIIEGGKFIVGRGNAQGEMPAGSENYRRIGSAFAVSAQAYYDDFILADEDPNLAVEPQSKLSICWGKLKK